MKNLWRKQWLPSWAFLVGLAGVAQVGALAQGQFVFNNRVGNEVNARFVFLPVDPADASSSSVGAPDWIVELYGGPAGTPISQLVPLEPPSTTFRGAPGTRAAGFVTQVVPTVPGVEVSQRADILVRAVGPGGIFCDVGPYTLLLGGDPGTPPNLPLGDSPILLCFPEPSITTLALLGIGLLLALHHVWPIRRPRGEQAARYLFVGAMAAALLPLVARAQGQFVFNNRVGTEVNAKFQIFDPYPFCVGIEGPTWYVQLLGGPAGTPAAQLQPLQPSTTTFRTGAAAGYVIPITVTVPGVPPQARADVLLRLLKQNSPGFSADLGPFTIMLGGDTILPPNLPLGNFPVDFCIPEPSPLLLFGCAAVLWVAAAGGAGRLLPVGEYDAEAHHPSARPRPARTK